MQRTLTSFIQIVASLVLVLGFVARAEDAKTDPTGTWTWTIERNGQSRTTTLKLKMAEGKLTGKISGRGGETDIEDAKVKGDEVTFSVTREFNGNKMTQKYSGKLKDNSIKGKIEFERDGQTQSRDWEAKREEKKDK
jgi:hypothetical protein